LLGDLGKQSWQMEVEVKRLLAELQAMYYAVRSSVTVVATKKRWSDFSEGQRAAILVGTAIEVVLTTVALADLARRSRAQVRGPKSLWVLGCIVQPVGPIAYLAFGRRSS
jgi:Phospholipase_D-nuclease N-terminal